MNRWRDFRRAMSMELILLTYVIVWVTVLLLTHMVTK